MLTRLAGQLTAQPAGDPGPFETGVPISIPPATVEMQFMKLHVEGRFDQMWDMLRLDHGVELLDMQVVSVNVLKDWTDQAHQRTYVNVARMVMRYRVRQQWREWSFDRQLHLVPAAGSWRTLCYPTRAGTAAGR